MSTPKQAAASLLADWEFSCPPGFRVVSDWGWGYALHEINGGLRVLVDASIKADDQVWLHVSYSRKGWVPNHADTCKIKTAFIGERYAYAVFPPSDQYVNIHPNCLHLWARLDGERGQVLPEFSEELAGIGRSI